jgi:betaine-aldehyde dehydrogenase|tara:strand:+ start:136 stop:1656 length:1521 start_codon:yes stop_codon:yes gene_type:complete
MTTATATKITANKNHPKLPVTPRRNAHFIDGAWVEGEKLIERKSPAHNVLVSLSPEGDVSNVDAAVAAARRTFDDGTWPGTSASERAQLLAKTASLIRENLEELALYDCLESGKPIGQARAEMGGAADTWDYAAGLARTLSGDSYNQLGSDTLGFVMREPVGVIGMITPWNFPLVIISQKLPYALAAGCTAVIKPSEFTSSSTVRLCELLAEAGLPAGVVNCVTGYGDPVGKRIVNHPDVDMVSFTGSTAVGKKTAEACSANLKKVTAELGGKNPVVVFPDADLEAAADAVVLGALFNAGQCCVGGSRLIIHESIAKDFTEKVIELMQRVKVGDPLDDDTQVGAIINDKQHEKILEFIENGKQSATLRLGGESVGEEGLFITPTVFDDVTENMDIAQHEIFGPVLSVLTFKDKAEALRIANGVDYGLSSSVWTTNIDTGMEFARGFKAGTVWMNTYLECPVEVPFGGFKESGIGRENGRFSIEEYTELKTVLLHTGPRTSWFAPRS